MAAVSLSLAACGGGGGGGGATGGNNGGGGSTPPPPVNRAPLAANDTIQTDNAGLATLKVLANDSDPDSNPLTVTIDTAPSFGTAAVNADGSIKISGLPGEFKGVTWFRYKIADPAGLTATASAVVYVGTDKFRVAFVGDAPGNGSNEVYLDDFTAAPVVMTQATEGTMRLAGFQASDNGATIVYRRSSTGSAPSDLSFVRTATPTAQVRIALPAGATLAQKVTTANGAAALPDGDIYRVSPDGQWIAFVVDESSGARNAYVVNVSAATTLKQVGSTSAVFAAKPRFSRNSQSLYVLLAGGTGGGNKTLNVVDLTAPATAVQISDASNGVNDINDYQVGSDQRHVLLRRKRNGLDELDFIDATTATAVEKQVYQAPALTTIDYTTLQKAPGLGASVLADKIAYNVQTLLGPSSSYVRVTDQPPAPQAIVSGGNSQVIGFRPSDEQAALFRRSGQIYEKDIKPTPTLSDIVIGAGNDAWYDSTGGIILLQQSLPYTALAVVTRGSLGNPQSLGSSTMAAAFFSVSGFDRGVVILAEGPTSGTTPTTAPLSLVNASVPDKLIPLATFSSPLNFPVDADGKPGIVQVVGQ